jgi:hypothetical protein
MAATETLPILDPTLETNPGSELAARLVANHQLSALDAEALAQLTASGLVSAETEEDVLQWLAGEYGLEYTGLENVEPDRAVLGRFPARILLREEMLPLREENGRVQVALSRLFAAPGLDGLAAFSELKLQPVLAPSHALQREIKKHLGVGADTLNLLEQEEGFQVVSDEHANDGDLDKAAEDASIIRFVNQILGDALSPKNACRRTGGSRSASKAVTSISAFRSSRCCMAKRWSCGCCARTAD